MLDKINTFTLFCASVMAFTSFLGCGEADPLSSEVSASFGSVDGDYTGSKTLDEKFTQHLERTLDGLGVSVLDARTTNGGIRLDGSSENRVTIHIKKEVRALTAEEAKAFAQTVQIYVERNGSEIQIYKTYPKPPKNIQVEVTYQIQSPSAIDVRLGTINGGIQIRGMDGGVKAETLNGSVDLQGGAGHVDLSTINGDIDASVKTLKEMGRFFTTNGSVEVALPADFSGQLDARTTNGRVRCAFPISVPAGNPPHRLVGPLGGNTRVILLTTNGNVDLKRQ